jgi:hypothetical protein
MKDVRTKLRRNVWDNDMLWACPGQMTPRLIMWANLGSTFKSTVQSQCFVGQQGSRKFDLTVLLVGNDEMNFHVTGDDNE